jgi:hypothetical protein
MGTQIAFERPDGKDASGYLAKTTRPNAFMNDQRSDVHDQKAAELA